MPNGNTSAEEVAKAIIRLEKDLAEYEAKLKELFPEASDYVDDINAVKEDIEARKKELKEVLAESNDFDIHQIDGKTYSLTKVVKMKVKDIDEVEPDFKHVEEVADEKRAAKYYKLYGEPPKGFEDNSYNKINWKEA